MSEPVRITSEANPRIKHVLKLRTHRQRRKTGLFIAEGLREVTRAAQAGLVCREVFWCEALMAGKAKRQAVADQLAGKAALFEVGEKVFRKAAYVREPEGVLAVFEQPRFTLESLPSVDDSTLYLVAVGIEKPGNLGAMVRTAEAAGCAAVLVADAVVDVFNPNAIRASTGAVFSLPVVAGRREEIVSYLSRHAVRCLAAMVGAKISYRQANWSRPLAVVIGPEDRGLEDAWQQAAQNTGGAAITIPMQGRLVDSLNASNAAAILLFHAAGVR